MANLNPNHYEFIADISYQQLMDDWEEYEGTRDEWQNVAQEKGWDNWREWREFYLGAIKPEEIAWKIYKVLNPLEIIPEHQLGPTPSWHRNFSEEGEEPVFDNRTFKDLIKAKRGWVEGNGKIVSISEDFPPQTRFIDLITPDGRIITLEGHHRKSAITLLKANGRELEADIYTVIGEINENYFQIMMKMVRRGSTKAV